MNFSWNCGGEAGTKLVALLYRRAHDAGLGLIYVLSAVPYVYRNGHGWRAS